MTTSYRHFIPSLRTPEPSSRSVRERIAARSVPLPTVPMGRATVSVAVIDAQTSSRLALPLLLPSVFFAGVYETTEQFLAAPPSVAVVVMDLDLVGAGHRPVRHRLEAVQSIVDAGYRVCIYTNERINAVLVATLLAGARGVVAKTAPITELADAVHRVAAGELVITPALAGVAAVAGRAELAPRLSPRQQQILSARARGEKFDSIASRLSISKRVAEEHWAAVVGKFADFMVEHSAADLERSLGLEPGDLLDWSP